MNHQGKHAVEREEEKGAVKAVVGVGKRRAQGVRGPATPGPAEPGTDFVSREMQQGLPFQDRIVSRKKVRQPQ